MQLLNPGNIVTGGLQIYRYRLKSYFIISLIAHLWLIIPLLGWAKFFTNAALISRLVFQEITGNSETLQFAQKQVNRKLVGFLLSAFIVTVVVYTSFNFLLIVIVIIGIRLSPFLYSSVYAYVPKSNLLQTLAFLTYVLFIVFLIGIFIASIISVYAQFFITEVILAVETNINMWNALKKSNKLISSYGFRPQLIITIGSLICLPILLLNQILFSLLDFSLNLLKINNSSLYLIITVALFGLINIIILPFWQAIKALIYYDIQNRREGLAFFISQKTQE